MARVSATRSTSLYTLLLISSLLLVSQTHVSSERVLKRPPIEKGLSWGYYTLCPLIGTIVRNNLNGVFKQNSGVAPGLLRLFFHDCFAQGCDASILLNGDGEDDEKQHDANIGIRSEAIEVVEDLRSSLSLLCPFASVSCSDILVLAASEAVYQLGGPELDVPLGRKDSLTFNASAPDELPSPFSKTDEILEAFAAKNFDAEEVVALSGAHTYGRAHCPTFFNRIAETDPPIDADFRNKIAATCPDEESFNTMNLDVRTPEKFDNMYYINLLNRQGLFTSDQDLASNSKTKEIVNKFASDQKAFFDKFADAFVKVSQLNVITDKNYKGRGEVRKRCFFPNKRKSSRTSVEETVLELAQQI
ncbi:hypothetical protein VNO77_33831 [Canavalia gladiata]|uniref:Peroxidase n=1 Tax=Canavalia gladiata TaxID=3824 RepID=A0AAN9PY22_CANGL